MAQTEAVWAPQLSYVKREPYDNDSLRNTRVATPPASPTRRSPAVAYSAAATLRHMHNFNLTTDATGHLLPNEEVENFLTTLDRSSGSSAMFQQQHAGPPTYHHDTTQSAFVHSTASPVYVPTTRAMLPTTMPYSMQSHNSSRTTWPMQPEQTYSASANHGSGVSPPFSFPPTPSPPMATPCRTDGSYTSIGRTSTLNPYPYSYDLSAYGHFSPQSMIGGQQRFPGRPGMSPLTPDYSKSTLLFYLPNYSLHKTN